MRTRSAVLPVFALGLGLALSGSRAVAQVQEFNIPSEAGDIAAGFDGNVWVTQPDTNRIARITPQGQVTTFTIPTANARPQGITRGPDNALWFCEQNANRIGRITSNGNITEFPIQSDGNTSPARIALGGDNRLWFTQQGSGHTGALGRMTTSGTYSTVPLSDTSLFPYDISEGPDGNLWLTTGAQPVVARMTTGGTLSKFPLASGGYASRAAPGPDGAMWFTVNAGGAVILENEREPLGSAPSYRVYAARLATNASAGSTAQEFLVSNTTNFRIGIGITAGPDGNVWFDLWNPSQAGRITTSGGTFSLQTLPAEAKNADPLDMVAGPDGAVWYTAAGVEGGPPTLVGRIPMPCPGDIPNFRVTSSQPGPPITVTYAWDPPAGANAFTVYELMRATSTSFCSLPASESYTPVASTRGTSITVSLQAPDTVWFFFVRVKGCPDSTTQSAFVEDTFTQLPGTPQLAGVASGANQVLLTYSHPDGRTFELELERALGAGAFARVTTFQVGSQTSYCPPGSSHTFTDQSLAPGTYSYRLVARNLGTGQKAVISQVVTVVLPPSLTLTPSPLNLRVQGQGMLTATLNEPLATAVTLAVSTTNANVATPGVASVTIPAGQTTAQIAVNALSAGNASIVATLSTAFGGGTASAAVVVSPNVSLNLSPSPLVIRPGQQGTMTATLSEAQSTPTTVTITSSNPAAVSFASGASLTLVIPGGQASATFPVNGLAAGTSTLTASLPATPPFGGGFATANVVVKPFPTLSLSPNPASVQEGASLRLTAFLSAPETADVTLALSTSAPAVASMPQPIVTIPAGAAAASFTVQAGTPGTAVVTAALPAALGAAQATANVTVNANPRLSLAPATLEVRQNSSGTLTATLSVSRALDTVLAVSSSDSAIATVPPTVTVPAGQTSAPIAVNALAPGTVTVTAVVPAELGGASATAQVNVAEDCDRPAPPSSPRIEPSGNPNGPVTGTDFLTLRWNPATGPLTGYDARLGGEDRRRTVASQTTLTHPPVGANGGQPLQLFVRSVACTSPEKTSDEVMSAPIVLANSNPVAAIDGPASAPAGSPVTFTDRSTNATSWLWFTDETTFAPVTTQAFRPTFTTPGTRRVFLIAGNGNGSSLASRTITITAAGRRPMLGVSAEPLRRDDPERQRLDAFDVGPEAKLLVTTAYPEGAVLYLRFLKDGALVSERRLVIGGGEEAMYTLTAFVPPGTYDIEVVGWREFQAFVVKTDGGEQEEGDVHAH